MAMSVDHKMCDEPSLSLSLSFTNNFRLNVSELSKSSPASSRLHSPVLHAQLEDNFERMTLSLSDDDDDDHAVVTAEEVPTHDAEHQKLKAMEASAKQSLFVFCTRHLVDTITPTPTPRAATLFPDTSPCPPYTLDSPQHALCGDDEHEQKYGCMHDDDDEDDDDDDDMDQLEPTNPVNPFLMGLAIAIPNKCSSSEKEVFVHHDPPSSSSEIESCDEDEEDDEYGNDYFVDDSDADECSDYGEVMQSQQQAHAHEEEQMVTADIDRKFMMKKYKYIDNIGIGASGIVDKVLHRLRNEFVAIKQSRSIGDEVLKQFRNEYRILKEFADCPHIINLTDYGRNVDANQICLALQYMDIGSLKRVKRYRMDELKYICRGVLSALQALHAARYVHNDIKPDNILISSEGGVKLIDFGCTMQMKDVRTPLTKSIGSVRYLSFEKRFISPIQYTTQSDIYSFGLTISEIFNGEHNEYHAKTPYDHYFMTASPKLKATDNAQFTDFISKCIEPDPERRWTASQLLQHSFLGDVPVAMQFSKPQNQNQNI